MSYTHTTVQVIPSEFDGLLYRLVFFQNHSLIFLFKEITTYGWPTVYRMLLKSYWRLGAINGVTLGIIGVRVVWSSSCDGPTHAGSFDVTYVACLPNMVVLAPSDEAELFHMVATAAPINDRPSCFRYPRGNGIGVLVPPGKCIQCTFEMEESIYPS